MKYLRKPYPYCNLGLNTVMREDGAEGVRIFRFNGKGKGESEEVYYIHFHLYPCELVAVKFFLKRHKRSKDRYKKLSEIYDAPRVLATCLKTMFDYLEKRPYTSFCFIGMPREGESLVNTKRFRLYERIMKREFAPISFEHKKISSQSIYLLMNKLSDRQELLNTIELIHNSLPDGWMY